MPSPPLCPSLTGWCSGARRPDGTMRIHANDGIDAAAKARLAEQEQFLSRLRTDPVLAEKVIRQRLGYLAALGVDGIFSDRPALLRATLRRG